MVYGMQLSKKCGESVHADIERYPTYTVKLPKEGAEKYPTYIKIYSYLYMCIYVYLNNDSFHYHLNSTYCVPGTVVSTLSISFCLILKIVPMK